MLNANNRRIAKNTLYLYLRTLVVLVVSLYTSRLVLQLLGETDMGIYNIVGGIVTMMAFLQSSQSKATSRFITYVLGKKDSQIGQKRIFSACMTIHILLGLCVVVFAETAGLWIINSLTNIPQDRQFAANVIYQFSVIAFFVHFIRTPYDAVIIAHENMSVYAYMSVLEVVLQLCMVVLLQRWNVDRLIFYGALQTAVALLLMLCYAFWVYRTYREYRFTWLWDKALSLRILSFSGWTMLGSTANTATQQGVALLFNNYVGLVANTALGLASQVNAAVSKFVGNFTTAFNPQIIKYYAQKDYNSMHLLICRASKFSFVLCYLMAFPLIMNMDFVLRLWLESVPQYTSAFCIMILICTVIDATTGVFNTAITATGKVKSYQIGISISFTLDLLISFIMLATGIDPVLVFASRILTRGILNGVWGFVVAHNQIFFSLRFYIKTVLIPIVLTIAVSSPIMLLKSNGNTAWQEFLVTTLLSVAMISISSWFLIFNKVERNQISSMIKNKFNGKNTR